MTDEPHSAFILSDARNDWWSPDFIELMASRLALGRVHRMLDVGSGHGHWGHLWAPHLAPDAVVLGIDKEQEWVEEATKRSARLGLGERFTYRQGSAHHLPVADESFDMVTCQTALMHMADPEAVIAEMKRVLAPGGLLLLAEPNNLVSFLAFDSVQRAMSVSAMMRLFQFHLTCNQGRIALGEGDYAIGARLPQMLADQGMVDIRVQLNDHASPAFAKGMSAASYRTELNEKVDNIRKGAWLWNRPAARRLYLAGGGEDASFQTDFDVFMAEAQAFVDAVRSETYSSAGGAQQYLISARRESAPSRLVPGPSPQ